MAWPRARPFAIFWAFFAKLWHNKCFRFLARQSLRFAAGLVALRSHGHFLDRSFRPHDLLL
jgi:hypothetical protein